MIFHSVVIPMFGSFMHDAKAHVHRSKSGSLLAVVSEKEDLTRKHLKREKGKEKKKIRQIRVPTMSIKSGDKENKGNE